MVSPTVTSFRGYQTSNGVVGDTGMFGSNSGYTLVHFSFFRFGMGLGGRARPPARRKSGSGAYSPVRRGNRTVNSQAGSVHPSITYCENGGANWFTRKKSILGVLREQAPAPEILLTMLSIGDILPTI